MSSSSPNSSPVRPTRWCTCASRSRHVDNSSWYTERSFSNKPLQVTTEKTTRVARQSSAISKKTPGRRSSLLFGRSLLVVSCRFSSTLDVLGPWIAPNLSTGFSIFIELLAVVLVPVPVKVNAAIGLVGIFWIRGARCSSPDSPPWAAASSESLKEESIGVRNSPPLLLLLLTNDDVAAAAATIVVLLLPPVLLPNPTGASRVGRATDDVFCFLCSGDFPGRSISSPKASDADLLIVRVEPTWFLLSTISSSSSSSPRFGLASSAAGLVVFAFLLKGIAEQTNTVLPTTADSFFLRYLYRSCASKQHFECVVTNQ
mmetsp:Transcript_7828/g.16798  ORF Transcript_7828/g.16798 Transcript_7828/m.16798 type:complete len:315 (+) Transcript_7828:600-1544(+)